MMAIFLISIFHSTKKVFDQKINPNSEKTNVTTLPEKSISKLTGINIIHLQSS